MDYFLVTFKCLMDKALDCNIKSFCGKNILAILGFSCVIAVIALTAVGLTQNKQIPQNVKYGIVLDASSQYTSLYIYSWPAEKKNDTGVVQQIEECKLADHSLGPGSAKYPKNLHEIITKLIRCMERSREVIPMLKHQETPLYLGASEDMQLLRMQSEQLTGRVMSILTKILSEYPFNFQGATIMTGKEEGAYGWITINYLLGKFIQKQKWHKFISEEISNKKTFGALNMGTDATQISYVPEDHSILTLNNSLKFRLYGKDYYVYTHSFLCYGKDQALWQKLAKDIQVSSDGILRDPCFHPGYEMVVNISDLYKMPCTKGFQRTLPFDEFQIQGTGNYEQCQQSILELFNTSYCPYSQCAFNGVFLPQFHGSFGAFSASYFTMDFFNVTSEKVSQEEVIRRIGNFCSQPWHEVKKSFPTVEENFLSEYCFSGIYIISLFLHGYHFTNKTWENIYFMDKVRGIKVRWTLGYMLNLTNMIPPEQPFSAPFSYSTYVFLMILFSLILTAGIIMALFVMNKPSYFWNETV